jgi:soluble lytic murein transglycosylase-like protein
MRRRAAIDQREPPPPRAQPDSREQPAVPSPTRRGIAIDGNKVWVSELTGIILVGVLLIALLSVTSVIIRNEQAIQKHDRKIDALKAEKINTARSIEIMRERLRIVELLNAVVGKRTSPEMVYKLADLVYTNSRQYGYSPELLLAVIAVESRFNPEALGRYRSGALSGALGLMQIKYPTALEVAKVLGIEGLKPKDLMDPEINMILGTAYLTTLISRFRSFKLGILAYNLGPGTVRGTLRRNEQLPMRYYEKVLAQYYRLKALGEQIGADDENY